MKGIVFTELLELIEEKFGFDTSDAVLAKAQTSNGGAYTAVGAYDHKELLSIVSALSEETGVSAPILVKTFGEHLFTRFSQLYPQFFEGVDDAFAFLSRVESVIHVEVRKLYPGSELPSFEHRQEGDQLEMVYRSERPFADLAEGLIAACCRHYEEESSIEREDLEDRTVFRVIRVGTRTP